ncbi:phasin family protein [Acinetobacter sp. WCHAc010052]|uniref:phasin family protein n=1 Tax=Acinetobacter sp. WCHAc010052 TaxID=2004647 RepID=UPI000B3CB545|nr:phasin family protein [Acinetobacter sp. WCHAc010052]AXY60262.1 poly(hydroxyalcanoate) granule associated protein [Acinetobacter sp. WCHAc010052]
MDKATTEVEVDQDLQDAVPEKGQKSRQGRKSALDFRKYTKQIWLAGLGAFSRAEEEGNKLFDSLVKVGEELESRTTDAADQAVEKVSEKAKESVSDTKDKVERLLDQRVTHSLNRIGLVSVKDIQHLEQLIMQLHEKVDTLSEENRKIKERITEK